MNIFKILSSNDGSINEPNVSSFLAYLLDPNENHGLDSKFLEYFLSPLITGSTEAFKELTVNGRIRDLSKRSSYNVKVQAEITVQHFLAEGKSKSRDIDILVELYHSTQPDMPRFAFCIENKIKDGAINKGTNQLFEEISGLQAFYMNQKEDKQTTVPGSGGDFPSLSFIFLTPKRTNRAVEEFAELGKQLHNQADMQYIPALHMTWAVDGNETTAGVTSIVEMLATTLQEEASGNIEPIYEYTKHTLKSFLSFIKSDFQSYKEEKAAISERKDYGKTVPEYFSEVFGMLVHGVDYKAADIKKMVEQLVLQHSGKEIRKNTLDGQLRVSIVNDRNRRHYGVTDPQKHEINLFYYPDEADKKTLRKLDTGNPPEGLPIYWKDPGQEDQLGQCLLTDIYRAADGMVRG